VASIHPFPRSDRTFQLADRSFDAETTTLIGQAFDKVCRELHDRGQPGSVRAIIAKRIIYVAVHGERDPDEMCKAALMALGIPPQR
jgi:hypothetical protein